MYGDMASMVAKACSSTSDMAVQEKGSRNKRKFRADPPITDPSKIIPLPLNECSNFEFSAEKFEIIPNLGHKNECDLCCVDQDSSVALKLDLGLSCTVGTSEVESSQPPEDIHVSSNEFHDADWSDLTESQLEELVLSNLDTIFRSSIRQITASGYSSEVSNKAILRSGLWYGCKDMVSNIVDNTLAFLRSGQDIDPSREHYFEDLQQMEKYILAELVCLLREVRPFFSIGDAMWCLLVCDMNVSHACAMDSDPLSSFLLDSYSKGNSSISSRPQFGTESKSYESNITVPFTPNVSASYSHKSISETPVLNSIQDGHSMQSDASGVTNHTNLIPKTTFVLNGLVPDNECRNSSSNNNIRPFSASGLPHPTISEEKFVANRKVSGITKRENVLRQKSTHLEKHYRTYGSKVTSRNSKLSNFSSLVLDRKLTAAAGSTGINAKNGSFKVRKGIEFDAPQDSVNQNLSASQECTSVPTFGSETINGSFSLPKASISPSFPVVPGDTSSSLPTADTELSLSFPLKSTANPKPINHNIESAKSTIVGASSDKSLGHRAPLDRKDEMIMKLVPRVRELQIQLEEWTEWANQKVMQAARRLSKDKAELKALRQEKEEVERLKKEKQTLEENTTKKLSEMENALRKAGGQVERVNAAVRRLEVENAALWREMEAAKLRAAESAASCEEVLNREKKTLLKFQSWEKQKIIFQEELSAEKHKLKQLQQELQQAKEIKDKVEAKRDLEEKANSEVLTLANSFRKEREQIEATAKSKEDAIKLRAENNLQKHKYDIENLGKEIAQLRLKTDSSKIAALRRGIDGSYASKLTDLRKTQALQDPITPYISNTVTSTNFHGSNGTGGVKRERECVMCLSEEMSVVFLPCAHQVVCTMCNELHEKQGMKDCPSCRSPIQRRVSVRYRS
ncbi:putative E3 ubiquitin-protein ligase RF298 isoform X1 [Primulina tabacum]|uniref:putative E3 ubiquitin-protein ligase RF298 isoform X1 n=2 Tax=Primulina tabacum TaxID=48773 RepID=UPI003F5973D5